MQNKFDLVKKNILTGFPSSHHLTSAHRPAHQGRSAGTDQLETQRETCQQIFFLADFDLFYIIESNKKGFGVRLFCLGQKLQERTVWWDFILLRLAQ